MDDSVIIYDEVRDSYNEEIKTISRNFNEKIRLVKHKVFIFYMPFY